MRAGAATALADRFELACESAADAAEVAWVADAAAGSSLALLDVGCGVGRMLVPLAVAGRPVHGVDASASALALCAERLAIAPRPIAAVELVRQPPAELNLPFRHGAAYIGGDRFQRIVDPTAALALVARVAAHLVAPGVLLLDLVVPAEAEHAPGGTLVEIRTAVDGDATLVARSETLVDRDGRRIDRHIRYERRVGRSIAVREDVRDALTWYAEDEVVALVRAAGFTTVEVVTSPRAVVGGERRFAVRATGSDPIYSGNK
ncbi:MAG: methyltransferase domain-containing protein [Proteobacteria bacterium]|nr:methyltransferase domain-containing protein [Pseudomonadota bacterium]